MKHWVQKSILILPISSTVRWTQCFITINKTNPASKLTSDAFPQVIASLIGEVLDLVCSLCHYLEASLLGMMRPLINIFSFLPWWENVVSRLLSLSKMINRTSHSPNTPWDVISNECILHKERRCWYPSPVRWISHKRTLYAVYVIVYYYIAIQN